MSSKGGASRVITQRIANTLNVEVEGVDLSTSSSIEFYIKQGDTLYTYSPTVLSETQMLVAIPKEDAMTLRELDVRLQFALTDKDGNARSSEIVRMPVAALLKEAGYGD